eukprot:UN05902
MKNLAHTFAQKMKKKKSATNPTIKKTKSGNLNMNSPEPSISNTNDVSTIGSIRLPPHILASMSPQMRPMITQSPRATIISGISEHHMNIIANSKRKRAASTQIQRSQTERATSR